MHEDWLERWRIGRTGWHEQGGNRNLKRHWRASGKRVLVPLCGKTPDLLWLEEQGNEVVGVEVSEIAVRSFFVDNDIDYVVDEGTLVEYRAVDRAIAIFCGDYFQFEQPGFDAHYDRGALVALSADLRPRYARHTSNLLTDAAVQLVVTVEYDQSVCAGPPYSIDRDEVLGYWPRLVHVASVDDTANAPPKFLDAGLDRMYETIWRSD